jgi:HK97 family phage major capsid protein
MNASVINNTLEGFAYVYAELDKLDKKATLTPQEERQRVTLLSKAAAMRTGMTLHEINGAHTAALSRELGISENEVWSHRVRDPQAVADWRAILAPVFENENVVKAALMRSSNSREAGQELKRLQAEVRANAAGTQSITYTDGAQGGFAVPFGFDTRQDVLMSKYNMDAIVMPPFCTEFETGRGNPMSTPEVNDVTTTGSSPVVFTNGASSIVNENTVDDGQDIQTDSIQWRECPTWRSGIIQVSLEMFTDAQYGVEGVAGLIEAVVAKRHAIGLGAAMITGAGLSAGLTGSLVPSLVSISAANALALNDFINLYNALPVLYRQNAVWYMHSNTQIALYKLLQTSGRSATELPTSFMGRPIAVCNSMNATGAGAPYVVVLADPNYLQKRKAGTSLLPYFERYADSGSVGFQGLMRADFNVSLWDSPYPPVAALSQHS